MFKVKQSEMSPRVGYRTMEFKNRNLKYYDLVHAFVQSRKGSQPAVSLEDIASLVVRILPQGDLKLLLKEVEELKQGKYGK